MPAARRDPASTRLPERVPKPELHVHLDGSLRPTTMIALARERDVPLPAETPEGLARAMRVEKARSLEEYLAPFAVTLSLLQDAEALERVAYELAADQAAEGVLYSEVRFCPSLSTKRGLTSAQVLDAVMQGLDRARTDLGVRSLVLVSALRTLPPPHSSLMAELAVAYRARGVCGFDLAGAEAGHPVHDHVDALRVVSEAGLPVTIHAGEGYGPESIREALELGRARRIGHGTRLGEDPEMLRVLRDSGVPLEVCLTSNVQTGAAPSYRYHPIRRYFDEGVRVCLCTDNRLVSGVTLTREYEHARDDLGFTGEELLAVARTGFESAFAPDDVRSELLATFDAAAARLLT